ncbi:MAG: hypothetical protein ABW101_11975 [Candidatus Thiodiazotropha sp.]
MNPSFLELPDIINELRRLGRSKATGSFYIVSDEQHSATVDLEAGRIILLRCRLRFGEQAIPLIARIKRGSFRFEATRNFIRKEDYGDNETVFQRIMQVHKDPPSAHQPPTRPNRNTQGPRPTATLRISANQRMLIEQLLIAELGPMGSVVMESVLACRSQNAVFDVIRDEADDDDLAESLASKIRAILETS